jgi:hypothetical protein
MPSAQGPREFLKQTALNREISGVVRIRSSHDGSREMKRILVSGHQTWSMTNRPVAALLLLFAAISSPLAQTAAPKGVGTQDEAPAQAQPAPQPSPTQSENPGLINEMGKLFEKVVPSFKRPGEAIEDLNTRAKDAAKNASDALSRLKPGSIASGRVICPLAANGTPDCKLAADRLCQTKGLKEGQSLSTNSAETCSPKVLIPGRQRKPDDCRMDTYVTTAVCQ